MSVEILYNNTNPFEDISNVPFIGRDFQYLQYGERHGVAHSIRLEGTISGECGSFSSLVTGQRLLLQRFGQDYKTLEVRENGQTISSFPYSEIQNISFGSSRYVGLLDYTIDILCYPEQYFSGTYGITEPNNTWSFSENDDGTINIEHQISAKGFNTNENYTNALDNARNYVLARTGWNNDITPAFIDVCSGLAPCLQEQSEEINRFEGTYSIRESYIADPRWNSGILKYTVDLSSGIEDGITNATVNGNIFGCKDNTIEKVRQRYQAFDIYSEAVDAYSGFAGNIQLNPDYLSSGVQENQSAKTLSFAVSFDNDERPKTTFDYTISYNTDFLTDLTDVNFRATIIGRGDLKTRWQRVQQYYSGFNFGDFVQNLYNQEGYAGQLNPNYLSSGVSRDSFNGVIGVNLQFNNEDLPPSGLEKYSTEISFEPALHQYVSKPLIYGTGNNIEYDVQDLGYATRARLRINGDAMAAEGKTIEEGKTIVKNELNFLSARYLQGYRKVLEENTFSTSNEGQAKSFSFSAAWSAENPEFSL